MRFIGAHTSGVCVVGGTVVSCAILGFTRLGLMMLVMSFAQLSGQPYGSATVMLLKYCCEVSLTSLRYFSHPNTYFPTHYTTKIWVPRDESLNGISEHIIRNPSRSRLWIRGESENDFVSRPASSHDEIVASRVFCTAPSTVESASSSVLEVYWKAA